MNKLDGYVVQHVQPFIVCIDLNLVFMTSSYPYGFVYLLSFAYFFARQLENKIDFLFKMSENLDHDVRKIPKSQKTETRLIITAVYKIRKKIEKKNCVR